MEGRPDSGRSADSGLERGQLSGSMIGGFGFLLQAAGIEPTSTSTSDQSVSPASSGNVSSRLPAEEEGTASFYSFHRFLTGVRLYSFP